MWEQTERKQDDSLVGRPKTMRTITCDSQRQARELISGPHLGANARFLSFKGTQSRAVTGFLNGYNTLRRHIHLIGLSVHCVGCVQHRMKPRPTLYVNVRLWLHSDVCIWAPPFGARGPQDYNYMVRYIQLTTQLYIYG